MKLNITKEQLDIIVNWGGCKNSEYGFDKGEDALYEDLLEKQYRLLRKHPYKVCLRKQDRWMKTFTVRAVNNTDAVSVAVNVAVREMRTKPPFDVIYVSEGK